MEGYFVAIEGPDGVGKTTMARWVAEWFRRCGREVVEVREPGGTKLGEWIRHCVKAEWFKGNEPTAMAELCLFSAARAQLIDTVIRPALNAGKAVVADRWTLSTVAYQGGLGGLGIERAHYLVTNLTGGLRPDRLCLLDCRTQIAAGRLEARGMDRLDNRALGECMALRAHYHRAAQLVGARAIDAGRAPEVVLADILAGMAGVGYLGVTQECAAEFDRSASRPAQTASGGQS